jgi:hypothetical protein
MIKILMFYNIIEFITYIVILNKNKYQKNVKIFREDCNPSGAPEFIAGI